MTGSLPDVLIRILRETHQISVDQSSVLGGGDIHQARLLKTGDGRRFVLKYHAEGHSKSMLSCEKNGLLTLRKANAVRIPDIFAYGTINQYEYLLMEYLPQDVPRGSFWTTFGRQLARLHQNTAQHYGFFEDNFIGSLDQSNRQHPSWAAFYVQERLAPQRDMAKRSAIMTPGELSRLDGLIASTADHLGHDVQPALLHGDLWQGNFICLGDAAALIDPAVFYGDREMDLAMSRLFGGFHDRFYDAYTSTWKPGPGWEERLPLYQLYYLLVHVNLFGRSYVPGVMRIVDRYL